MSKSSSLGFLCVVSTVFLSACGGGSSGSSAPTTPVVLAASSFQLQSGYKALVASGRVSNFAISGTCAGSATFSVSTPSNSAVFEGAASLSSTSTMTLNFTNCTPASAASTTISYFDSNYNMLGHNASGVEYGKYLTIPTQLPISVKVGDTNVYGTETIYTDSTKQTMKGQRNFSYVIESDGTSTSTAIANFIIKDLNTANQLLSTQQQRYRIAADGTLTTLSIDVQYSTTSTNHLLYTAR